ncbi:MAG TPA: hypothetical protein PL108_01230 [Sediminibacterium sp.]|jgi:hypothetical protein|nr:hypothetical protein [Sediminibacterium sp.]
MLHRLKNKWQVSWLQFTLIFTTFALGGSLCGFLGRQLLSFTNLERGINYFIIYIIVVTILWPFCVLLVSVPFGQFSFFKRYLGRIKEKMTKKQ